MKKNFIYTLLLTAILLSACGSGTDHYDLPPTDPNYIPGKHTSVNNTPTLTDTYNSCVSEIQGRNPDLVNTDLFGDDAEYWQCGDNPGTSTSGFSLMMVPAVAIAKVTPIKQDDVAVIGVAVIEKVFYVLLAVAAGVTIGEAIVVETHSNQDHNPNKLGSTARKQIETLLALLAGGMLTGGPGPDHKCGIVKNAAGAVIRAFIWVADTTYPEGGFVAWYFVNSNRGPWGGAYGKTIADFNTSMSQHSHPDWTSELMNCNDSNFPHPPTFLQAGQ